MNLSQLQQQVGTRLKLRPVPRRSTATEDFGETQDDEWTLDEILTQPNRLRLTNVANGVSVELETDNIREYRSPQFLILRCQITVTDQDVHLEPEYSDNDRFKRLERQMPALLTEMRADIATHPFCREVVLLKRDWSYWAKGNELSYYFDDHPDLLSQFHILENNGLVVEVTSNNTTRYRILEDLARYLGG
ncbi:MAG TPA: hypothetical protein PKO33_03640 [Pyrinomonadaceae bacterium]|nr:hypothetical protein [Pyrinomonadaceae bacterium]